MKIQAHVLEGFIGRYRCMADNFDAIAKEGKNTGDYACHRFAALAFRKVADELEAALPGPRLAAQNENAPSDRATPCKASDRTGQHLRLIKCFNPLQDANPEENNHERSIPQ
jgi:hypothetical protein